MDGNIAND